MTLKQLEAFYWAARLGTFAIAAQRLHVTQSSLSKRIAELETDLGYLLFDRTSKKAVLTEAGESLLTHAGQMLKLEEHIRENLDPHRAITGDYRFGLSELSATTWFPEFMHQVRDKYPGLSLHPQVGIGRSLEKSVERGELDCAVIAGPPTSSNIASEVIAEIEFSWMASPNRLPQGTVLTAKQFQNHPLITSTPDSGLSIAFDHLIRNQGIQAGNIITCNSLTAIIGLTVSGEGISFLPKRYVMPLVKRKLLVPIKSNPAPPLLKYSFIWRKDENRRFVSLLKDLVIKEVDFNQKNLLWS
jgi:DNA-binding transcriptional LysR family regulator